MKKKIDVTLYTVWSNSLLYTIYVRSKASSDDMYEEFHIIRCHKFAYMISSAYSAES